MDILIIENTPISPYVSFNPNDGIFEISGYSRPEDGKKFFYPLIEFINNYQQVIESRHNIKSIKSDNLLFIFKFRYINSASTKFICEFLFQVLKFKNIGVSFTIKWFYENNDEEMRELGEDISDIIDYPLCFYSFTPENK